MKNNDLICVENEMGTLLWAPSKNIVDILFPRASQPERSITDLASEISEEDSLKLQVMIRSDLAVGMFLASQLCFFVKHSDNVDEAALESSMSSRSVVLENFIASLVKISKDLGIQEARRYCRSSQHRSRTLRS